VFALAHLAQRSYFLISDKPFLALKPLRQVGNSDAVGFAETDCREFAGVDCPANLFIVGADEFRGLFDCDRDWLDRRKLQNSHGNPLGELKRIANKVYAAGSRIGDMSTRAAHDCTTGGTCSLALFLPIKQFIEMSAIDLKPLAELSVRKLALPNEF
jgi:hypothetical protein